MYSFKYNTTDISLHLILWSPMTTAQRFSAFLSLSDFQHLFFNVHRFFTYFTCLFWVIDRVTIVFFLKYTWGVCQCFQIYERNVPVYDFDFKSRVSRADKGTYTTERKAQRLRYKAFLQTGHHVRMNITAGEYYRVDTVHQGVQGDAVSSGRTETPCPCCGNVVIWIGTFNNNLSRWRSNIRWFFTLKILQLVGQWD